MTGAFAMPAILAGTLLISLKAAVVAAVGRVELDVEENPPSQPQTAAMELDVDGAAFSSAKSDDAWSITGPTDLDSLWAFARPMLTHYLNDDVDNARFNSLSSAFKDLIMFTDFSGVGFPESALGLLNEAWRWHTGLPTNVRTWRASDILPHCRKVLAQGATASAPLHVFGNILRMLPVATRKKTTALHSQGMDAYDEAIATGMSKQHATTEVTVLQMIRICSYLISSQALPASHSRKPFSQAILSSHTLTPYSSHSLKPYSQAVFSQATCFPRNT